MKLVRRGNPIFPGSAPASVGEPVNGVLRVFRDGAHDGAWNMAQDAELLAAHHPDDDPILRIYRWSPPCVTIGYNQNLAAFADQPVKAAGYGLERRPTGGRAILHANELTYAVVGTSPGALFGSSLHEAYMVINQALLAFLVELGISADVSGGESRSAARGLVCFHSAGRYEIRTGGRKIIGSAQRRMRGVFLQHGSILAGPEHRQLVHFLDLDAAGREQELKALEDGTTDLGALLGRSWGTETLAELEPLLVESFAKALVLNPLIQT